MNKFLVKELEALNEYAFIIVVIAGTILGGYCGSDAFQNSEYLKDFGLFIGAGIGLALSFVCSVFLFGLIAVLLDIRNKLHENDPAEVPAETTEETTIEQ